PSQERVADRLFDKTQAVLGDRNISDFRGVEFLLLTPCFLTLQHQTMNRLAKSGLVSQDKVESCVIMYEGKGRHMPIFESFKERALTEHNKLFVMIADECHLSPTAGHAHDVYVNSESLHGSGNFVLL
ncbi:unnamed protein product, partial [Ectocarpus sp. 8 AP-2014]